MTKKDKLIWEKLLEYKNRFHEPFPIDGWVDTPATDDELIQRIDEALRTGKKAKKPRYKKGLVY